ncbi:MAG: ribonuclease P protein component [Campylobacter sp.]|nr:ribonuclease P protein component [Campylobacter sp.]
MEFSPISKSWEFNEIYSKAKKWHCDCAVVYYLAKDENKFSVIASKKMGNAVKRNRAKRVVKAAFLDLKDELKPGSYVIITRVGINDMKFSDIKSSFKWSFKRLDAIK